MMFNFAFQLPLLVAVMVALPVPVVTTVVRPTVMYDLL